MSEFGGEDGPHGMDPRKLELTASEKLRLIYATGTVDPAAPRDEAKHAWHGTDPAFYNRPDIRRAKEALDNA